MRDKRPCLIFAISNFPLVSIDDNDNIRGHVYCFEPEDELQKWIKKFGGYKIIGPYPEETQLFVGKYYGENNLEIYRTKRRHDPDTNYPHRFKMSELVCSGHFAPRIFKIAPQAFFTEVNTEIFYGPLIEEDPWVIFKKLAWFQDICCSLPSMINRNDKEIYAVIEWAVFHGEAKTMLDHFSDETPPLLRTVRDNPDALRNPDILEAYIDYRKCMRGDYGRKEAKIMRDYFNAWSIPKKNDADARKQNIAISLLGLLAKHLNDICRKDSGVSIKAANDSGKKLGDDKYRRLKKWAKQNNEARIAAFSPDYLSSLLFKTEPFVNAFLPNGFGESARNLRRHRQ